MTKEEKPLSRAAYRQQQTQQAESTKATEPLRRREANQPSRHRTHGDSGGEETIASPQLKKRLNWSIGIVVVLIVLVYLVLFFV
ncbi:hypothetical protein [Loigolactobacillus jiayinensis]|uniref:Uncharacterized protein n=1 Tax=Loigolactobacillus jiayinensis TaxID=2486016 RepID=A0ABW1RGG7_9LACO|nr:hypothetical protein [Loigolactobacillus jiayinensis]